MLSRPLPPLGTKDHQILNTRSYPILDTSIKITLEIKTNTVREIRIKPILDTKTKPTLVTRINPVLDIVRNLSSNRRLTSRTKIFTTFEQTIDCITRRKRNISCFFGSSFLSLRRIRIPSKLCLVTVILHLSISLKKFILFER